MAVSLYPSFRAVFFARGETGDCGVCHTRKIERADFAGGCGLHFCNYAVRLR